MSGVSVYLSMRKNYETFVELLVVCHVINIIYIRKGGLS